MPKPPVPHRVMQIRAAVLSHYEEVARALDLNPQPLLRKVGLTRSVLAVPTQLISVNSAVGLLELTAEASGCDTVGLMMAEARLLSDFGPISLLLMQQRNIRSALHTIAQYRHLLNESLGMHIEEEGKYTVIREEIMAEYPGGARQSTDMAVGVLILIFRAILGPNWRPHSVYFTHAAPRDSQILKRIFRCPLHFNGDFNGLMCLSSDLEATNVQADPAMASYAQSFLEAIPKPGQSSFVLDVRRSVYLLLPMGRANVEQVASGLGMNVRTLQRRLDDSQVSFSDILNAVRCELAQRYIKHTSHAFGRVAELLGYSNTSSFNRWFTVQFGCTPSQMRV
jgi:AraC-like DNA-binding protein